MFESLFDKTIQHLKPDPKQPGYFLLTKPHLLYLSNKQSKSYLRAMENPDYSKAFHDPTVEIIEANLEEITSFPENTLSLIDLGPGYPDKSLPIAKHLKEKNITLDYYPVDISLDFLQMTVKHMEPYSRKTVPIHSNFEECFDKLPQQLYQHTTFCMIGLTFMNFQPDEILPLLKKITTKRGTVILATELINQKNNIDNIITHYTNKEAEDVAFGPLKNLGFDRKSVNYIVRFNGSKVEMLFELKKDPPEKLKQYGPKIGDHIITAVSYRYTKDQLKTILNQYFKSIKMFFSSEKTTSLILCK